MIEISFDFKTSGCTGLNIRWGRSPGSNVQNFLGLHVYSINKVEIRLFFSYTSFLLFSTGRGYPSKKRKINSFSLFSFPKEVGKKSPMEAHVCGHFTLWVCGYIYESLESSLKRVWETQFSVTLL